MAITFSNSVGPAGRNSRVIRYTTNQAVEPSAVSTFSCATLFGAEQEARPSENDITAALAEIWDKDEIRLEQCAGRRLVRSSESRHR